MIAVLNVMLKGASLFFRHLRRGTDIISCTP